MVPPGSPGTGSRSGVSSSSFSSGTPVWPWLLPHLIFNRRPFMINLLNDFSAAASAACLDVNCINAHCCLETTFIDLISPYW